jgi:Protein of unknown function (DUF3500)
MLLLYASAPQFVRFSGLYFVQLPCLCKFVKNTIMKSTIASMVLICTIALASVVACKKTSSSSDTTTPTTAAAVSTLSCSAATVSSRPVNGSYFTGTVAVPYSGGNSVAYAAGSSIASTGVKGLTATLQAGTLANGSGSLTFGISGTPTSAGTANFAISFGGQSCAFSVSVDTATNTTVDCSTATGTAKVVCLANAFKATLSSTQLAALQLSYSLSNAKTWSNLPASMSARIGLKMGTLNATQLAAAKALIQEISGTTANEGYDEIQQLWLADDYLYNNGGGSDYGSGNYYIGFFGTPAMAGTFEIQMTGHHKTLANTYINGSLVGATPHFEAVEPLSFTSGGTTYAPINQEAAALSAMLKGLTSTQLTSAKLSKTYTDILLGPKVDWQFPTAHEGLQCNTLSAQQKELVIAALKTYVNDIDDANAATILAKYTNDLDNTFIAYSGTTDLATKNDYVRIDGNNVWIEFTVQGGIVYKQNVHYHSVWRDRVTDYGGTK